MKIKHFYAKCNGTQHYESAMVKYLKNVPVKNPKLDA
jgi:hypothetical protein